MKGYYINHTHFDGTPKWYVEKEYRYNVVYQITIGNAKYIGSSCDLMKRLYQHVKNLRDNNHHSDVLQNEFNKYHYYDLNILEVLGKGVSYKELLERERFYIEKLHPNANIQNSISVKNKTIKVYLEKDVSSRLSQIKHKNIFINNAVREKLDKEEKPEA